METRLAPSSPGLPPWLNIGMRVALAVFGAYGFGVLAGAAFVRGLPFASPRDAVAFSLMLGFLLDACAVVWVFAAATVLRAALGLFLPALFLGAWLHFSG
ncbi:MAG: iron transporter [Candidatus Accumulibacter sp.]|jgi:hypothetical protein|nr:iron transporter [Accumulibacter sp.]